MRPEPQVLFLDFDGVICDSLEECYRSSWLALEGIPGGPALPPDPPHGSEYRQRFDLVRPFIRSGEDYLVAHGWAGEGRVPRSQAEFDASLAARGPEAMAALKAALYRVREDLLAHHRGLWLGWNPLYPGMTEALRAQADHPDVWILSTKKAEFIAEILKFHGVTWPRDRIIYTGPRRKLDLIAELAPGRSAELLDDQIDHLDFASPTVRCVLALWGYAAAEARTQAPTAWTLDQALDRIRAFPRPRGAGSEG